jgi:hypothetical protein
MQAKDYASKYAVLFGGAQPTYAAAASSAAGYVIQQALSTAFAACNFAATTGSTQLLLYSTNVLNCSDNQNNGRLRVLSAMSQLSLNLFYGDVVFDKLRQNYGASVYVEQVRGL